MSSGRPGASLPEASSRDSQWWWVPAAFTVVTIVSVIGITLWQLHPHLLLSNTTTTGGDTGAHIALPKYLQSLLKHGQLSGWDPGWYDGFPLYTYYFTLPDLFAAVGGWIIPYNIAFKLTTILGSVLLPVCAWACGRLFRLRAPIPAVLAAITLPFLFDYTFTIYGGNLFSTMAGEYAFSFSLSMAVLFIGLFARAVREGKYRVWAAIVLAVTILSHIVPAMFALVAALVLTVIELLPAHLGFDDSDPVPLWQLRHGAVTTPWTRVLWWSGSTVGLGLLLSGWWLVPFGLEQSYATSMNYSNVTTFFTLFFPGADAWALVIAGLAIMLAILIKSPFGLMVASTGTIAALALILDPQGSLYNVRLLPLWFIAVYLMTGWGIGTGCWMVAQWWRDLRAGAAPVVMEPPPSSWVEGMPIPPARPWEPPPSGAAFSFAGPPRVPRRRASGPWAPGAVGGALIGLLTVIVVVVPPMWSWTASKVPVTLGANEVTNWSSYNYSGYQNQPSYPEYLGLINTMKEVADRYGCGRAMWEYSDSENRFGTPEALMLFPYWTDGCVDSMEGLLFESSATTPYHFINQAELSAAPSEPEVGLPYGPLDIPLGVQHLQLLGVKYFVAETSAVESMANADPDLTLVASSGPWTSNYNNATVHTTWEIFTVKHSQLVTPLKDEPAVVTNISAKASSWLTPSLSWYDDPSRWNVELALDGPSSWPRTTVGKKDPPTRPVPSTKVSHISTTDSTVSFHVSRTGTPVLVKVSYFPNWHASGADGPWRVTPNLMVVVPTSHTVTLTYGRSAADDLGDAATLIGVALVVVMIVLAVRRKRRLASFPPPSRSTGPRRDVTPVTASGRG